MSIVKKQCMTYTITHSKITEIASGSPQQTYLEAGGPVEELHHMPYTSFRGLWEAWFKPLDYKEN